MYYFFLIFHSDVLNPKPTVSILLGQSSVIISVEKEYQRDGNAIQN